jgi:hypothetical protein
MPLFTGTIFPQPGPRDLKASPSNGGEIYHLALAWGRRIPLSALPCGRPTAGEVEAKWAPSTRNPPRRLKGIDAVFERHA